MANTYTHTYKIVISLIRPFAELCFIENYIGNLLKNIFYMLFRHIISVMQYLHFVIYKKNCYIIEYLIYKKDLFTVIMSCVEKNTLKKV